MEGKWIEFILQPKDEKRKTDIYFVNNKQNQVFLGRISWHGGFRKYSFFPAENLVFESQCLQDITDFLNYLTEQRKKIK